MSINSEQKTSDVDMERLEALLRRRDPETPSVQPPVAPAETHTTIKERKISLSRTAIALLLVPGLVGAGVGLAIGAPGFFAEASAVQKAGVKVGVDVKDGKGTNQEISFVMPPQTVATSKTETVDTANLIENIGGVQIPTIDSVKRQDIINTGFEVTYGKIDVNYDIAKKHLIYGVSNAAVSTYITVDTISGKSQKDLPVASNLFQDIINGQADNTSTGVHALADITNAFNKKQITAEQVPILGELADKKLTITQALGKIADVSAQASVNEKCVPEIVQIPGFEQQFSDNIKKIAKLQLFNDNAPHKGLTSNLSALMSLSPAERNRVIAGAEVDLDPDYASGLKPQKELQDAINYYENTKIPSSIPGVTIKFSIEDADFTCKTSKKLVFIDADGKVQK
jgi:hypothetical protein